MKNKLVQATFYLTLSSFAFMISGYIINIWLGRFLGPEKYGIFGIIISLVTTINLTQTSGLPQAVSKYIASENENKEAIFKVGLILQIISTILLSIVFYFLSNEIATLLKDQELVSYLQLASLIFPFYGFLALLLGYYNGMQMFKKQAYIQFVYSLTRVFSIIGLAVYYNLSGVIVGFIIAPIIAAFAGLHFPKSKHRFSYKKLIKFSIPLIGIAIFINLLQSIDLLFIKYLLGSKLAPGYYTATQNISRIPFFALSALSVIILPSISLTVSKKLEKETKRLINQTLRIVLLLLTPLILMMSATSKELVILFYSPEYIPASHSLSILLFGIGFLTIFTIQSNILSGANKPRIPLYISMIGVFTTSIFCLLLIPNHQLNGAAYATSIGSLVTLLIASIIVYKKFKTLVSLVSLTKIVIASLIIYFLILIIPVLPILLPLLYILLFVLYLGILILLKEITREDIKLVQSLLPSSFKKNK